MNDTLTPIVNAIAPTLRAKGFKRRSATWNRRIGDFIDVVSLQLSKSLDRVWVNVGVTEARAYINSWGSELPTFVPEGECTVRMRLGLLIDGHDISWRVKDSSVPDDIAHKVATVGLPYLDSLHTYEALEKEMATRPGHYPPEVIGLAVIRAHLGDTAGACGLIEGLIAGGPGAWLPRVQAVQRKLGCRQARLTFDGPVSEPGQSDRGPC